MLQKLEWLAKESRPEIAGAASILAARLHVATVGDALILNKAVANIRSSAKRTLTIWRHNLLDMCFLCASDVASVGTDPETCHELTDGLIDYCAQGAWMVLTTNGLPQEGEQFKASPISWRSTRIGRSAASPLAGEAVILSQSIAEVEWLQLLYRDVVYGDLHVDSWQANTTPFTIVLGSASGLCPGGPNLRWWMKNRNVMRS